LVPLIEQVLPDSANGPRRRTFSRCPLEKHCIPFLSSSLPALLQALSALASDPLQREDSHTSPSSLFPANESGALVSLMAAYALSPGRLLTPLFLTPEWQRGPFPVPPACSSSQSFSMIRGRAYPPFFEDRSFTRISLAALLVESLASELDVAPSEYLVCRHADPPIYLPFFSLVPFFSCASRHRFSSFFLFRSSSRPSRTPLTRTLGLFVDFFG